MSAATVVLEPLHERVLALLRGCRRAGMPVSQQEAITALEALGQVSLLDREVVRASLAAVCVTQARHRELFDDLFELYLPPVTDARGMVAAGMADLPDGPNVAPDDGQGGDHGGDPGGDQGDSPGDGKHGHEQAHAAGRDGESGAHSAHTRSLLDAVLAGDRSGLRRAARAAVDRHGSVAGRDGRPGFVSAPVVRAMDLEGLRAAARQQVRDEEPTALAGGLRTSEVLARIDAFEQDIRRDVRRRTAEDRGPDALVTARQLPLEDRDLLTLGRDEQRELRSRVQQLTKVLATRRAGHLRASSRGRLDVRRTARRSLATGGVPFQPVWQRPRERRPDLFVVCDVSGSVSAFARFTLLVAHALQERFSTVRSFAFIDTLDEVSEQLRGGEVVDAIDRLLTEAQVATRDAHSDYGRALGQLHDRVVDRLGHRSTILVLGDARTNHRAPQVEILAALAQRAGRVYWLNPEPQRSWDTGDSVAGTYAAVIDGMYEVRTVAQLTRFIDEIA